MEYIVKKTTELSEDEKKQICDLFLNVFEKEKTLEDFNRQFLGTFLGYSLHCIMVENYKIVGINTIIPYKYKVDNFDKIFALSVDTMVEKNYRSLSSFTKMSKMLYKSAEEAGICLVFGFPNDISYKIFKKMLKWKDIGKLDFYILPIKVGKIIPSLKPFNFLTTGFSKIVCSALILNKTSDKKVINIVKKVDDSKFYKQRYNVHHNIVEIEAFKYVYKLDSFQNIKVCYLIDVIPLSKKNMEEAIANIYKKHSKEIEAILYVGYLKFRPINLLKVPQRLAPKNVNMSYRILNNSDICEDKVSYIENWEVNLSNMDVV